MTLLRLSTVLLTMGLGFHSSETRADVPPADTSSDGSDGGSDTGDSDDDGGCATAAAAGSVGGLGLGVALLFGLRRED